MNGKCIWLLVSTLALLGLPSSAQQSAGSTELQVQGALVIGTGDTETGGSASVLWGRFLTDRHELGGMVTLSVVDSDVSGSGGPFYRYNFAAGKVVPFLGVAAETSFGDEKVSDDLLVTFEAGVRYFLSRNTALSVETRQLYDTGASEFVDGVPIFFGFSHFWDSNRD